ncbi:methyltransferase [Flavobacterium psychrophilum]|uniref:Methyltransferase n=1 Tax=Flavobacterium psychrophilum (strain ATCC 49511 / DSM 21280 / CIP 103535 / JIP02/86) TaxID=402612 RepID=A6GXK8_FLAPJ|nr:class I SAM-dependent methyltransferase [Flavobacterium psychrophilum]AIG29622.1 methyltransferase [Flavobacterium psychrophilum]AIG31899.1 methyltransferase [Flavobacterium psychrophilum]AIG34053.1 methyltransferase [Flavobacterium psychrophilum]AIG36417.1 methyltransferase [Flavobacterium psychrophilum]AIG38682.1 methyltransferase [Flavobacterium psychrophilum]
MLESEKSNTSNLEPKQKNWFATWFDSPYYHILYKDRNLQEAQVFMDNLTHYLNLPEGATVLDLACGKGRHAIYLNQLGFNVLGVDLSPNSIAEASKNNNMHLNFRVHDMREAFEEKFDAIFNLFTSFGYFESDADNLKTLISIKESLSEYGFAVIDFMNVNHVIENLVPEEVKTVDGINFYIKRYLKEGYIYKEINFEDKGEKHHFTEKVQAITLQNFEQMMEEAGIYLLDIFGDYKLKKFHKTESERLIMIFK